MADATVAPNKLALSHALGAAFLKYQVTQLEHSVDGNWRERRADSWRAGDGKRNFPNDKFIKKRDDDRSGEVSKHPYGYKDKAEHQTRSEDVKVHKDADVIVLDASVLIYGLYHLKKWAREGREEIVVVPLEVLNTLDLLKKDGRLAQRARIASRFLEAQVGTNSRIRVQRDDAFVLWDDIPFDEQNTTVHGASPEWVRRTICCARWELEHAVEELDANKALEPRGVDELETSHKPRVVLAVISPSADVQLESANPAAISASPVPLPAPQPNKHESRLSAALVARWAAKTGVELLQVSSTPPPSNAANGGPDAPVKGRRSGDGTRRSIEEERTKRAPAGRGRLNSRGTAPRPPFMATGLVERPQAVLTMMEMVTQPNRVVRVLARGEKLP